MRASCEWRDFQRGTTSIVSNNTWFTQGYSLGQHGALQPLLRRGSNNFVLANIHQPYFQLLTKVVDKGEAQDA